jgi:hypothetical protein
MKITKEKLREIILEELEGAEEPHDESCLCHKLAELIEAWDPQTDEGKQYEEDLEEVLKEHLGE